MAYITIEELDELGGNAVATDGLSDEKKLSAIAAACSLADSYIRTRHVVPLADASVDDVLKLHVARAAFFFLISGRGYDPNGSDQTIRDGYSDAVQFFRDVSKGVVVLNVPTTADGETNTDGPAVYSDGIDEGSRWGRSYPRGDCW